MRRIGDGDDAQPVIVKVRIVRERVKILYEVRGQAGEVVRCDRWEVWSRVRRSYGGEQGDGRQRPEGVAVENGKSRWDGRLGAGHRPEPDDLGAGRTGRQD